jgi:hypothetical protein
MMSGQAVVLPLQEHLLDLAGIRHRRMTHHSTAYVSRRLSVDLVVVADRRDQLQQPRVVFVRKTFRQDHAIGMIGAASGFEQLPSRLGRIPHDDDFDGLIQQHARIRQQHRMRRRESMQSSDQACDNRTGGSTSMRPSRVRLLTATAFPDGRAPSWISRLRVISFSAVLAVKYNPPRS